MRRRRRPSRAFPLFASSLTTALVGHAARADGPSPSTSPATPPFTDVGALAPPRAGGAPRPSAVAHPTLDAFSYVEPQEKRYLRGALEVATVLIVGNVDYLLNTSARGGTVHAGDQRWDLRYDWPTFHDKLTGDYWKLDTNHFNTNFISHPFAGTLYYTAARSNHLSVSESFGYALVGALSWEMFGELREEVSINDVIVTSTSGLALGETFTQLSSFFYRSKKSFRNDVLAALFSPAKALNDFADGAEHARSEHVDAAGLTEDEWHDFRVFAGVGATKQPSGTYFDQRFGIDLHVVNLPGYDGVAHRRDFFDDGNSAQLHFEATLSGGALTDGTFATRVVPLGVYTREGTRDPETKKVHGEGTLLGWLASFEYSMHDYDRDRSRPRDLLEVLSPVGVVAEYAHQERDLRVKTGVDVSADFAGVEAYGLHDYRVRHRDDTNLQSVLKLQGYYYGLGVTVAPHVELGWKSLDAGGRFAVDTWRAIQGFDEQQQTITREIGMADRRLDMRAWLGLRVPSTPLRVEALGRRRVRSGEVGDVRGTQGESSLFGSVGVVF